MPTLTDLLDTAAGDEGTIDPADVHRRVGHRRRRRWMGAGVLAVAVAIGAVGTVGLLRDDASNVAVTSGQPREGKVFSFETETQLVFDDGYDGYVFLDLDSGRALHRSYREKVPGDHRLRIARFGDSIVSPAAGGMLVTEPSSGDMRVLPADAGLFVPAGTSDQAWLVQTASPAQATRIDAAGRVVAGPFALPDSWPRTALRTDVAFEDALLFTDDIGTAHAWNPDTGEEDAVFPDFETCPSAVVSGELIAYAVSTDGSCETVEVRDRQGGLVSEIPIGSGVEQLAVQPGGRRLAVLGPERSSSEERHELFVFDLDGTGGSIRVHPQSTIAWSRDGRFLFIASYVDDDALLAVFDTIEGRSETARIGPLGERYQFVALPSNIGPDIAGGESAPCTLNVRASKGVETPERLLLPTKPCRLAVDVLQR